MKIEDLIKMLQELKEENGNLDVYYFDFDEYGEEEYYELNSKNKPFVSNIKGQQKKVILL